MKKEIATTKAPAALGPYSQAIEANGMLFVSGQIPIVPATGALVEGDIKAQTRQSMENIADILAEAGYTFDNVVKTTCLLADLNDFAAFNQVYGEYFGTAAPARATFAVKALPKGALVEVEVIAAK